MKPYLRSAFILLVFIGATPIVLSAQKSKEEKYDIQKYKVEADTIRKEVWAWDKPEFKERSIPADFAKASKVIIARHLDINADSKKKTKFLITAVDKYQELMLLETLREVIKINDKAAVDEYSEIEFTQIEKKFGFHVDNTTKIFVGIRIIKPNGNIKDVDPDEVVYTRNESTKKDVKLAIPDLQAGDIIDYFIAKRQSMERFMNTGNVLEYTFPLYGDAPVMHYSIHCEIGKNFAIEYRCYNGAEDFKKSKSEEGDNILDLVKKNIPANTESDLWTAPYRQSPIIRVNVLVGYTGKDANRYNLRAPGMVYSNQSADEFIQDEKNTIADIKRVHTTYLEVNMRVLRMGDILNYFEKVMKNKKNMSPDSLLNEMYYMYRFKQLLMVDESWGVDFVFTKNGWYSIRNRLVCDFAIFLNKPEINNQLILLTPISKPAMNEVMDIDELSFLLISKGEGARIFSFRTPYTLPNYLAYDFENAKQAVTIFTKGPNEFNPKNFEEGRMDMPGTTADKNARIEKLAISLTPDLANLQTIRNTTLRGHYKEDVQTQLILFEDLHNAERKAFGLEPVIEQMTKNKRTKKYGEELKAAFDQVRSKQKDDFITEAKDWFEQEITDLTNYKVDNMGVRHTSPDFIYSSEFKIGGLIKKAGNNLILEVGKLQGSPLKINADQRKRTLDIYMPFARSLQTEIVFQIPDGYTIEGVSSLNKKVENETGHFTAEATSDGKTVTIKISRAYNHSFEPAANWDKLLAFIDASNEWTNSKLLLKKK
jgi:hypothetical protein